MPTMRLKDLVKCDWSANPQASAISVSLSAVDVIMCLARSTLRAATYAMGEDPRLCLKARQKWLGLNATESAMSRNAIFDARLSSMYSRARLTCQAARPPGRQMLRHDGAIFPIASDSPARSVHASLRQRQATARFDSNNVIARITRYPARAEAGETDLAEGI